MTQKSWVKAGPLVFEQSLRRVRVEIGGIAVADRTRVLWLWEEGKVLPLYLFPSDDARTDLLRPSEHPLPEAHHGLASYSLRSRLTDGWPRTPPGPTRRLRPPRERGSQTTWPSIGERWMRGFRTTNIRDAYRVTG